MRGAGIVVPAGAFGLGSSGLRSVLSGERMEKTSDRTANACFIKFDMPTLGMILREVVPALEQELVIVGKTTVGVESVHVKHDYYALWEKVLHGLVDEFVDVLREESLLQERHTELRDDIMRFLEVESW